MAKGVLKELTPKDKAYYDCADVMQILGVSRSKAYQVLQGLNRELKAKGYITISGKCPVSYFEQKFYGLRIDDTFLNQVS